MKKTVKALRVIVLSAFFALVPMSVMAGGFLPGPPGGGGGNGGGCGVPEPSTLLLLAAGGGIMMVKKFRKK
jgi:hypothetical protein